LHTTSFYFQKFFKLWTIFEEEEEFFIHIRIELLKDMIQALNLS